MDKKDMQLYVKGKCVGTKQSLKTKVVDGNSGKPEWKEELQFQLNPTKVRKMSDRIIEFKVMRKAPVMDDCIGTFEVALDGLSFFEVFSSPNHFMHFFFSHTKQNTTQLSRVRLQSRGFLWSARRSRVVSCGS